MRLLEVQRDPQAVRLDLLGVNFQNSTKPLPIQFKWIRLECPLHQLGMQLSLNTKQKHMHKSNLHNLFGIFIVTLCLSAIPLQSQAATKGKHKVAQQSGKERIVLMPLHVPEEDSDLAGAMETALVKGLQQKYDVFSGEQVAQKARAIYLKINKATAVNTQCDETRCMQYLAEAFQAELIATANVIKKDGSYFLSLSIQNIFDNLVVQSESLPCERCTSIQVVEKLKVLSGIGSDTEIDQAALAAARKAKAEQLKQEQLVFEQKLSNSDATERKKLLDAKAADDKRLAEIKAAAVARRTHTKAQPTTFPSFEQALAELSQLNDKVSTIETGYEKELADTRNNVNRRYSEKLDSLKNDQRDEFESVAAFEAKQDKKRNKIITQRDAELARLNTAKVAASETAPFKERIKALNQHEYIVGSESIDAVLGEYDVDEHQFLLTLNGKSTALHLKIEGKIPLNSEAARAFSKQWKLGLVRPEAKAKLNGDLVDLSLVNDADNSRLNNNSGRFMTSRALADAKLKMIKEGYVSQGGLTWMPVNDSRKNWSDANTYCSITAVNGQTGWRLPTYDELSVLLQSEVLNGKGWKVGGTWSSKPASSGSANPFYDIELQKHNYENSGRHYVLNMRTGYGGPGNDEDDYYVTCVH
jgi:hypothetical protein